MIKPIKPEDMVAPTLPDYIIKIFNQHIKDNFRGRFAIFPEQDVINAVVVAKDCSENDVVNGGVLDNIQEVYRDAGWMVQKQLMLVRGYTCVAYRFERP